MNDRDWSDDANWSTRILELFDVRHIPRTAGARQAVALFILGKYGASRKTPNERATDFNAEAERYVGRQVIYRHSQSTVSFLSVMGVSNRVMFSAKGKNKVGIFAAYIENYYVPTTLLKLVDSTTTSE